MEASLPSSSRRFAELGPSTPPTGTTAAIVLGSGALLLLLTFAGAPLPLLVLPALLLGTTAAVARPEYGLLAILLASGFIGTLIAFTGLPVGPLTELGLLCLLFAAIYLFSSGRASRRVRLWAVLIPPSLYLLLTVIQLFTSESLDYAFQDFRITTWYMAALLILALGPWGNETYKRVARGLILIAGLVGAYAIFRYVVGPSPEEFAQARGAVQRIAESVPIRFFGSFLSAFQLAAWCAAAVPFLLALSFVTRGRWRAGAVAAIGACLFGVLASEVRTGLVAVVFAVAIVVALFLLSRAFHVERFALGFFAVLALALAGVGGYTVVIADSEADADRFSRILNPGEDEAFQDRMIRWEEALDVIDKEPFGYGLGTQGLVGQNINENGRVGPFNLDSAFLKVGIQQGYLVMALFVLSLLVLLGGLAQGSITTADPWRCALGIGACGTLVAQIIFFFSGIYSEGVTALFAWILIGIGAAQFTSLREPPRPVAAADPG